MSSRSCQACNSHQLLPLWPVVRDDGRCSPATSGQPQASHPCLRDIAICFEHYNIKGSLLKRKKAENTRIFPIAGPPIMLLQWLCMEKDYRTLLKSTPYGCSHFILMFQQMRVMQIGTNHKEAAPIQSHLEQPCKEDELDEDTDDLPWRCIEWWRHQDQEVCPQRNDCVLPKLAQLWALPDAFGLRWSKEHQKFKSTIWDDNRTVRCQTIKYTHSIGYFWRKKQAFQNIFLAEELRYHSPTYELPNACRRITRSKCKFTYFSASWHNRTEWSP